MVGAMRDQRSGLGARLRTYREARHLSVPALARLVRTDPALHVSVEAIRKIEDGRTASPGAYLLDALARHLGTSLYELMYGTNPPGQRDDGSSTPPGEGRETEPSVALLAVELLPVAASTSGNRDHLARRLQSELRGVRERIEAQDGGGEHPGKA